MDRAVFSALLIGAALLLSGCKYIYGESYVYLTVQNPATDKAESLYLQVMTPGKGAPQLSDGLHPGIIFVHGGGWSTGGRFDNGFDQEILAAAERGYVAATIDYRLSKTDSDGQTIWPWPAQIQDLNCAVRWLKANAADLQLDPDQIVVMGISAGGHLALVAAENQDNPAYEAPECNHPATSTIAGAAAFSGVGDIETTWNQSGIVAKQLTRLVDSSANPHTLFDLLDPYTRRALLDADPMTAIGASDVPVFLAHPVDDILVPVDNSIHYHQALVDHGRPGVLITLDRGEHFTNGDGQDAMVFALAQMYDWLGQWLWRHQAPTVCGGASQCLLSVPEQ